MDKCKVCGKEMDGFPYSDIYGNKWCSLECHEHSFWDMCLDSSAIIINGVCYHDGGNGRSENGFKGFGGSVYHIRDLRDGREWETDNLWYNGKIPAELRENHLDTHEFI